MYLMYCENDLEPHSQPKTSRSSSLWQRHTNECIIVMVDTYMI